MATDAPTSRELDAFREDADRFIAELDEEYYLHLAGHKETLELEPIYERHEELTRLETAQRLEGAPHRALALRLRGLPRRPDPRARQEQLAEVEAELEATVDGEQIPYRMLRVAMANEPDRDRRERLERARLELARRAAEPASTSTPRGSTARRSRSSARRTTTSSTSASASGSTSSPRSAARCSTRPSGCGRRPATGSFASGSGSASTMRARPTSRGSSARPSSTRATPPTGCCPRSRRRSATSGSTCAPRRTSTSTSSSARARARARSARRSRCPGKVMLVIQPIGGHDDWRALFHEAGHTEHYANTSRRPRRWRRSASATWPSPRAGRRSSSISSTSPPG